MTRATPLASQPSTVVMSRMPPPSCTGIVDALAGSPRPPRHSSACRRRRRRDRRRAAIRSPGPRRPRPARPGSSLKTVAWSMSPCFEADAAAVLEVDGGKEDHGRHLRKLAISARPSAWLFSGWNCVPAMLSRADDGGDRPAIIGGRDHVGRVARRRGDRNARNRRAARPGRSGCRRAADAAARASSVFQPMCGIFSAGSSGSIAFTSPAIQPRPVRGRRVRGRASAISCMPTQMPRNGAAVADAPLVERLDHAGHGVEARAGNRRRRRRRAARCGRPGARRSGSEVTDDGASSSASRAARSKALAAECRLPEP